MPPMYTAEDAARSLELFREVQYDEIIEIKKLIETRLKGRPHSNILYHLDSRNLSKYSNDELNNIFAIDKAN